MDRKLKITLIVTFLLFSFIIFLIYLLYCFAYYDKNQEEIYYNNVLNKNNSFVYDNLVDKDGLNQDKYNKVLDIMYDKKNLKDIYYLYYRNSDTIELNDFINKYYYGNAKINSDDITYSVNGKTGLFNRRAIFYKSIDLINEDGNKSSLGVKRNVKFIVENNALLKIDNSNIKCNNEICEVSKIFGGLHEISYISNGYEYYGLINIYKDEQSIEVTNIENLVRIDLVSDNDILVSNDLNNDIRDLKTGKYSLNKCYLKFSCPSKKKSYIQLNEDGTCQFYTYISLDQAGDLYNGTYTREGNFLVMHFDGHTYRVFDYDTKQSTDITAKVDIEMRYKIEENYTLVSDSYKFILKE